MTDFTKQEDVRRWLEGKPREAAVALAVRAALRVLPMVGLQLEKRGPGILPVADALFVQSTFQALAVAWIASSPFAGDARQKIEATASRASAEALPPYPIWKNRAASAAHLSAVEAMRAVFAVGPERARAVASAVSAAFSAEAEDMDARSASALIDDVGLLTGGRFSLLHNVPIWPKGAPNWAEPRWRDLKMLLSEAHQNWHVWTIWYDHRLDGRVNSNTREVAYVDVPDELLGQVPIAINAAIVRRIEEHEPPPQPISPPELSAQITQGASRKGSLPDFSNRKEAESWLADQPREAALIFAARAALRTVPRLAAAFAPTGSEGTLVGIDIILPVFRCMAAARVAGRYSIDEAAIRRASKSASESVSAPPTSGAAVAVYAAARAASASASSGSATFEYAADVAFASASTSHWAAEAAVADAELIDEWSTAIALISRPLWLNGIPKESAEDWERLEQALLKEHQDWKAWTNWYRARLGAGRDIEALEIARVLIADDIWDRGPRVVNAEIVRLTEEYEAAGTQERQNEINQQDSAEQLSPPIEAVPTQVPQALVFGGEENSPIVLVDPPGQGIRDVPDQRQGHADIREKGSLLAAACGTSNRLAVLKGSVSKLMDSMGASLQNIRVRAFWSQMNSLRRRAEADERARKSNDPDDPPLPEEVAGLLYDLRDTLNIFAAYEPKLVALDELKLDPAERTANAATIAAARQIAEASTTMPQAVDRQAADAVVQAASEAFGTTPADERAKEFAVKSARNLAVEAMRRAYKLVLNEPAVMLKGARDGAYRLAGQAGAAYGLAWLIKNNEAAVRTLIESLGGSQTLHKIIDLIIKLIS